MKTNDSQANIQPITINRKAASELSGIAVGTFANMASRREGPPFFKRGRKVLYDYHDFISWLKENPVLTIDSYQRGDK